MYKRIVGVRNACLAALPFSKLVSFLEEVNLVNVAVSYADPVAYWLKNVENPNVHIGGLKYV